LNSPAAFAIVRAVPLPRLLPLLAAVVLFTGCQNSFTRIRAINHRDEIIAEWTARGRIVPLGRGGYRIKAVERISGAPHETYTRYPDGWRTTVQGAHIWHWRCAKPAWLAELEGDPPPAPQ
jgi:hypothetical protein